MWEFHALMDVHRFDKMTTEDQLIEKGERDLAAKVDRLFNDIPPGSRCSVGEARFEE